ncbi:MAG: hypothetical protein LQ337_006124 [Flavoplaca oasis]|nr:MAG: hypothetical protein LQ337_006124 [Flavoplaca oasis]
MRGTIIGHNEHTKLPSQTVFIDDIAEKRALALDTEKVAKTQKSLITSDGMNGSIWYRAKEILKKEYMDEPINRVMVDNGKTMKAFNIKFAGFKKQICSLLDQWVQLKAKEEKER